MHKLVTYAYLIAVARQEEDSNWPFRNVSQIQQTQDACQVLPSRQTCQEQTSSASSVGLARQQFVSECDSFGRGRGLRHGLVCRVVQLLGGLRSGCFRLAWLGRAVAAGIHGRAHGGLSCLQARTRCFGGVRRAGSLVGLESGLLCTSVSRSPGRAFELFDFMVGLVILATRELAVLLFILAVAFLVAFVIVIVIVKLVAFCEHGAVLFLVEANQARVQLAQEATAVALP
mmetsp:Transcript_19370/g.62056  ORF Transcript_19370/g.62056 Transcript_19370/m.62056 type:complete len:230 (-) Transcript_19370:516-1205(-)